MHSILKIDGEKVVFLSSTHEKQTKHASTRSHADKCAPGKRRKKQPRGKAIECARGDPVWLVPLTKSKTK